jgi:pyruvate formate lyase activating enzyme
VDQVQRILEIVCQAKAYGMHVEVVTNVTPGINDSDAELGDIASWIKSALGAETPWHVTRFFPHWQWDALPVTPVARLEAAQTIGTDAGLWHVYVGNVPGHKWANTYCHGCGHLLIQRYGFDVLQNCATGGSCPACGMPVPGTF